MHPYLVLFALNICHWLADYTHLSNEWMLNAKRSGKPLLPILIHSMVHGILMGITLQGIFNFPQDKVAYLVYLQIGSHFIIDVWKGKMNIWFPKLQSPAYKPHWYVFGFDQFLHQAVIILMVYIIEK